MFELLRNLLNGLAVSFDLPILDWIAANLWCPFLDTVMPIITMFGDGGIFWIAIAVILFLTRKRHVIPNVIYVLISSSDPNEENTGPSAYMIGEKSSDEPFICIPHRYDMKKSRLRVQITTAYTLRVRCPARNITIAKANNITATHLSMELSKNVVA